MFFQHNLRQLDLLDKKSYIIHINNHIYLYDISSKRKEIKNVSKLIKLWMTI